MPNLDLVCIIQFVQEEIILKRSLKNFFIIGKQMFLVRNQFEFSEEMVGLMILDMEDLIMFLHQVMLNVLVADTEVYSNTDGQSSKATNRIAVSQFAADAYSKAAKDLEQIAMTYGSIYVASTCLLANAAHAFKAIQEAGEYNGPSLVVNYAPCINHGITGGLTATSKNQFKKIFQSLPSKTSEET
jgi:hypothetical protein